MEQLVIKNILKLYDSGFKIVPAPYKSKRPVLSQWQDKYFKSREELTNYLNRALKSNFVIVPNDDVIVFDVDNRNGGMESFEKLKHLFTPTFKVVTGSGGYHYYYRLPAGFNKVLRKNLDDAGYTGIDIKNKRGCLVAPESVHPDGGIYKIAEDSIETLADVPQELLKFAIKEFEYIKSYQHNGKVEKIIKGNRNNYITSYVGHLFKIGNDYKSVLLLAQNKNKEVCKPPLPQKEVAAIVKSISRYDNYNKTKPEMQHCTPDTGIEEKIIEILNTPKLKKEIANRLICKLVIDYINKNGIFYKSNKNFYVFENKSKKLIWLDKGNQNLKRLLYMCGINAASDIFKQVVEALCAYCDINGTETDIYKYSHYASETNTIYLKNGDNILKITTDNIIPCDNGTDKIMFTDEILTEPFEYLKDIKEDYLGKYLFDMPNYSSTTYLTSEDFKTIALIYFHSLFMPDLLRTKPIISTVGTKGSGKTSMLRMMIKAVYGKEYDVTSMTNSMEDLDTIISKRHFIVIDNLDTYREAINDKLASYATGVINEKRKLYSNGEVYREKVETFIGISTRNPVFRRDDVAQRVLVIYLEPLQEFYTEATIIDPLLQHRSEILSQVVNNLQKILRRIKDEPFETYKSSFRMADFANFTARFLGSCDKAEELLHKIRKTQKAIATEGDILFTFLTKYVAQVSINEWNTARTLYHKLDGLAFEEVKDTLFKNEFRCKYENSVSLGRRLMNIKEDVSDFIKIETKKKRGNVTVYRITAGKEFDDWKNSLI